MTFVLTRPHQPFWKFRDDDGLLLQTNSIAKVTAELLCHTFGPDSYLPEVWQLIDCELRPLTREQEEEIVGIIRGRDGIMNRAFPGRLTRLIREGRFQYVTTT